MKNTEPCKPGAMPAGESSMANPLSLLIHGIQIPAFKNRKRAIVNKATGKLRTLTDPSVARRMDQITEQIIQGIGSELLCDIGINESGTLTVQQVRSWIACKLPCKDSRQWIPSLYIDSDDCDRGEEGATITIERL